MIINDLLSRIYIVYTITLHKRILWNIWYITYNNFSIKHTQRWGGADCQIAAPSPQRKI